MRVRESITFDCAHLTCDAVLFMHVKISVEI